MSQKINIAIDGYSSTGKSTLARQLASLLGYRYIDTGAMYRGVTLYALRNDWVKNEEVLPELFKALKNIELTFQFNSDNGYSELFLNGENVEEEIRQSSVAAKVSYVAAISEVRQFLVAQQREMAKTPGVVMDGRDIGTVVLPDAELKIFMTAHPDIRVKRRFNELKSKGYQPSLEEVKENIALRDDKDTSREDSPLKQADSARLLDNSKLSIDQQLALARNWVDEIIDQD